MLCKLLCDYLINNNILSDFQINDVIDSMSNSRVKLGLIAVSEKLISQKQADEINNKQALLDKRFGDIAVELKYLTGEQVAHLLDMQGNTFMKMCQTFEDKNYLTLDQLENYVKGMTLSLGFKEEDTEVFKTDDIDKIVSLYLANLDEFSKELALVTIRTISRLITNNITIGKVSSVSAYEAKNYACQRMNGDYDIYTCFSGSDEGMIELGSTFAKEQFNTVDEDCLDSVAEFINVINGLYATSLSYRKIQVELVAPVYSEEPYVIKENSLLQIPIFINSKQIDLLISVNK